jgi:hypothetical protein
MKTQLPIAAESKDVRHPRCRNPLEIPDITIHPTAKNLPFFSRFSLDNGRCPAVIIVSRTRDLVAEDE